MCCSIVGPLNAIRELVAIYKVKRRHESCTLRPASPRPGSAPGRAGSAAGAGGAARAGGRCRQRARPGRDGRYRQRPPAPTGSARPAALRSSWPGKEGFTREGLLGGLGGCFPASWMRGSFCLWKDSCKVCVVSWKEAGTYVSSFAPGPGGGRDQPPGRR